MADVILVHGAATGGWLWDDVAAQLRAEGQRAFTPTLRGVGGPATIADRDVDLSTHIDSVTEFAEVEQLGRLTLDGFSYGGFVITGAAARLGDRVARLIYLDAFVPQPGRSFFDLLPEPADQRITGRLVCATDEDPGYGRCEHRLEGTRPATSPCSRCRGR
jgi:pimeloyl-ACP methyl ester carboxylesterase